ncbi:MAG: ABC transporter permease [Isosphaeraceae bacterium]|nr:ABC transporter permease [Isosphaeraceae bacterium]
MPRDDALPIALPGPLVRVGEATLRFTAYLGGLVILAGSALRALVRPSGRPSAFLPAVVRQCDWMFGMGLPLVALVHMGLGSFLAMQAFYGATFVVAAGPVVGLGFLRNVAPLMTGMTLAGLLAARVVSELRRGGRDEEPAWVPDREVARGRAPDPREPADPARLAAVRLTAGAVVGPVLAIWATFVGTAVGALVSQAILGVPLPIFLAKFFEMIWLRDAVGLVVKGAAFGLVAALFACFEGLGGSQEPRALTMAAFRAACGAAVAILIINNTWFTLVYLAGPPFGPTVLPPPPR